MDGSWIVRGACDMVYLREGCQEQPWSVGLRHSGLKHDTDYEGEYHQNIIMTWTQTKYHHCHNLEMGIMKWGWEQWQLKLLYIFCHETFKLPEYWAVSVIGGSSLLYRPLDIKAIFIFSWPYWCWLWRPALHNSSEILLRAELPHSPGDHFVFSTRDQEQGDRTMEELAQLFLGVLTLVGVSQILRLDSAVLKRSE